MGKKKKEKVKISFIGENSVGVTGSMTLIEYDNKKILIECGLFQSNNLKRDYEINTRKFKFKPKEIDYIFCGHQHIDHIGLIPRLYKEGCEAKIIATTESAEFFEPLLKDSAFIMLRDSMTLSRGKDREIEPIYTEYDVDNALSYLYGYDMNVLYELDENISFKFIPSGHIKGGCQIILYIKEKTGKINKILYTSDLGNVKLNKRFVEPFQKETKANIVIGECTYGNSDREIRKKDREKDIEKLRTVILDTCYDKGGRVLIPSFAMDRTQYILSLIYDIFSRDKNFDIPIIIDSPLACKITNVYSKVLKDEEKEYFQEVLNWKNVKFISDSNESKACVEDKSPKVIISSSGMLTAGRSIHYTKSILPEVNSTILFIGFCSENSLAYKIKNSREQKTITIDGKAYKNRCSIIDLKSFSSHMQHDDLLAYYSEINSPIICLVHGETEGRIAFKEELERKLRNEGKTTRISVVNKGTSITL